MKKTNLAKILFLAMTFIFLLGASVGIFANEATQTAEIVSKNVYYGETWNLMYAVHAENLAEGDSVVVDLYDAKDELIDTIEAMATSVINDMECYVFIARDGVAAQDIAEVFYAQPKVVNGDTVVATGAKCEYSVLEYLYERLYTSTTATDAQKNLYTTLVAYAKAAEAVLRTERDDADKIANYAYVQVVDGTVDGATKGLYKKTDALTGLVANTAPAEGDATAWMTYDADGVLASIYTDVSALKANSDFFKVTATTVPAADSTLSLTDANALGERLASNVYTPDKYYVTGMITQINDANNGTVIITDEDKNTFYIYRLYDATGKTEYNAMETKPDLGDTVTVYGVIGKYYSGVQMKNGWVTEHTPGELPDSEPGETTTVTAEMSFANATYRTVSTADEQIFVQNGITFTYAKGGYNQTLKDYTNPIRTYANTDITIEFATAITKIEITCNNASYATALVNSITSGATVTVTGTVVTIVLDTPATSFTYRNSAQVRINSLVVHAEAAATEATPAE